MPCQAAPGQTLDAELEQLRGVDGARLRSPEVIRAERLALSSSDVEASSPATWRR